MKCLILLGYGASHTSTFILKCVDTVLCLTSSGSRHSERNVDGGEAGQDVSRVRRRARESRGHDSRRGQPDEPAEPQVG